MEPKLYSYKDTLWEYHSRNGHTWVVPFCPIHKMELSVEEYERHGLCDDCRKSYSWGTHTDNIADYLRRKLSSEVYKNASIISIDGIQVPQVKVRQTIPEINKDFWVEARVNTSEKGRQIVIYAGEKGSSSKSQIFINADDEKLSFDHKDKKPEDIFTKITAEFPSGKKMDIIAPTDK
jgi:hypothetical protein